MNPVVEIRIPRGDTCLIDFPVIGLVTPLDDCDIWFTAKNSLADEDTDAVIAKTVGSGIVVTGGDTTPFIATVTIDPADTEGIEPPEGVIDPEDWIAALIYDVQIRTPAHEVFTVARGRLIINMDVTRSSTPIAP